jgi:serine/threonine protein kinase
MDGEGNIKLIDFGMSNFMKVSARMNTFCGSPAYTCPEVFKGVQYDGPEVDIWSLGVILFALVCGYLPFDEDPRMVIRGEFELPEGISGSCGSLITRMLQVDGRQRIPMAQILEHPWVIGDLGPVFVQPASAGSTEAALENVKDLDTDIIMKMAEFGFAATGVLAGLRSNLFNQMTATYKFLYMASRGLGAQLGQSRGTTFSQSSGSGLHPSDSKMSTGSGDSGSQDSAARTAASYGRDAVSLLADIKLLQFVRNAAQSVLGEARCDTIRADTLRALRGERGDDTKRSKEDEQKVVSVESDRGAMHVEIMELVRALVSKAGSVPVTMES